MYYIIVWSIQQSGQEEGIEVFFLVYYFFKSIGRNQGWFLIFQLILTQLVLKHERPAVCSQIFDTIEIRLVVLFYFFEILSIGFEILTNLKLTAKRQISIFWYFLFDYHNQILRKFFFICRQKKFYKRWYKFSFFSLDIALTDLNQIIQFTCFLWFQKQEMKILSSLILCVECRVLQGGFSFVYSIILKVKKIVCSRCQCGLRSCKCYLQFIPCKYPKTQSSKIGKFSHLHLDIFIKIKFQICVSTLRTLSF
eukprot:TRINITY_DN15113_c0_g2_i1.p1 TRINITY_DN15113_c0_g2~~TRINITY_DN15113_c0_g2_i1.p1  ORF type:complete len:252 (-),score=-26.55 TRINITY_DN15113_c0_g2_i1:61-816(-)